MENAAFSQLSHGTILRIHTKVVMHPVGDKSHNYSVGTGGETSKWVKKKSSGLSLLTVAAMEACVLIWSNYVQPDRGTVTNAKV